MAKLKHQRREHPRRATNGRRARTKKLRSDALSRAKLDRWRNSATA
jgi:hypothetical protein